MKSLDKALALLEYVVLQNGAPVTPGDAARALGMTAANCTRLMRNFVERGYLTQISRREGYAPGPMLPALCTRSNPFQRLAAAAAPEITALADTLGCQVNLAVLHREERIMLCCRFGDPAAIPWQRFRFTDHEWTATGRLLAAARDEGDGAAASIRFRQGELEIIGRLIRLPGYPAAAFGFGTAPERAEEAETLSDSAAEAIRRKLLPAGGPY